MSRNVQKSVKPLIFEYIYLADNQGQMLCCASPQEGQHNDLFELQTLFEEICAFLSQAGIDVKGLFLNADAGFDSKEFRAICEQKEIIANIPPNPRNEKETESTSCQYFDEALSNYLLAKIMAKQTSSCRRISLFLKNLKHFTFTFYFLCKFLDIALKKTFFVQVKIKVKWQASKFLPNTST